MMKRLAVLLLLGLGTACSVADEQDPGAVSTLKADLDVVVEQRQVTPVDGVTTAGQPDAEAFKVFADAGYVAVIDIRTAGEDRGLDEAAVVQGLGMDYLQMPVGGRDGITFENAEKLDQLIGLYDEPVLVHCGSANRVGALFALNVFRETGDMDKALEAGRAAGLTRLEGTVREVLEAQ
jgi:uncharacterized protein (TIGR01244 family)